MSADLTTTYLGLTARVPPDRLFLPAHGQARVAPRPRRARRGGCRAPLPIRGGGARMRTGSASEALWHTEEHAGGAKAYMANVDLAHLDPISTSCGTPSASSTSPSIASLNGTTAGGWTHTAELLQEAGADAIELNVYSVETDPYASGANVEERTAPARRRDAPGGLGAHRRQARALLHRVRERRPPRSPRLARTGSSCSTASSSPTSTSRRSRSPPGSSCRIARSSAWPSGGSRSSAGASTSASPRPAASTPRGRRQGDPRRRGRRDDDLRAAAEGIGRMRAVRNGSPTGSTRAG